MIIQVLMKLASEAGPRGNRCKTLVGDELELEEDRRASASGPPMEAIWFVAHPAGQFNCGCPRSAWLSWWPGSTPLPVDNFNDTSDEVVPRIEMERLVAEFIELALLLALSSS